MLAFAARLLLGLQRWPRCELGVWQPLPLPGLVGPLLYQVEGREKGFGPPQTLASLQKQPKELSGAILAQERLLQVMVLRPHYSESFVAGEGREKLRVSS